LNDANCKAYYRFTAGSELLDETANDSDLTAIGVPVQATPKWGTGCAGLGTSQAFSAVDAADFQPAGNFSVSAWIRTTKTGGTQTVIQSQSRNTNIAGLTMYLTTANVIRLDSGKNSGTSIGTDYQARIGTTDTLCNGNWHHVVGTYDGAKLHVYVDGAEEGTGTVWTNAASYAATNYVRVGCANNTGTNANYFMGCLDEVAFFPSDALSLEEVEDLYAASIMDASNATIKAKASAIYCFEDGYQLTDSSAGAENTLTAIGTPTTCTTKFGGSVFLGNSSAYSAVDAAVLKPTGNFTVVCWIKRGLLGAGGAGYIFQSNSDNTNIAGIKFFCANTTNLLRFSTGKNTGTTANTDYKEILGSAIADQNWHFVVVVWDGSYLYLYKDGLLDATPVAWTDAPAYAATNYVRVGCYNGTGSNGSYFTGQLDDGYLVNGVAFNHANVIRQYMGTGFKSMGKTYSPSVKKMAGVAFASVKKLTGVTNVVTS